MWLRTQDISKFTWLNPPYGALLFKSLIKMEVKRNLKDGELIPFKNVNSWA